MNPLYQSNIQPLQGCVIQFIDDCGCEHTVIQIGGVEKVLCEPSSNPSCAFVVKPNSLNHKVLHKVTQR